VPVLPAPAAASADSAGSSPPAVPAPPAARSASAQPAEPGGQAAESEGDVPVPAKPGIIALRPRPSGPPDPQPGQPEDAITPAGHDPWQRPVSGPAEGELASEAPSEQQLHDELTRARLQPVSRLNRPRRPATGAPEAGGWPPASGARQADTAV
jgi:hypothetical protein